MLSSSDVAQRRVFPRMLGQELNGTAGRRANNLATPHFTKFVIFQLVFWDEAALAVSGKIWEGDVLVLGKVFLMACLMRLLLAFSWLRIRILFIYFLVQKNKI
jgi:hypothetical protein